ncbi:hypothetical protein EII34_04000 [Arachnia propionica]|uniref:YchJ-like middle NTF2-like domain-containing protein n=1 Tax=Arachnia propionica TaxID=1750 RepID=A0A3P1TAC7_9ACTN|nr:YchJ family metal-binding protein [Arachnia propionica]RRD06290.1 hypothetical protein EII34_04000 [Arachnia propionica]
MSEACHCDTGRPFDRCCGPILDGSRPAATALALMRSRYTAYVLRDEAYLLASWYPETRPERIDFGGARWTGLVVKDRTDGRAWDRAGSVGLVAHYEEDGEARVLQEVSYFIQEDQRWYYLEGVHGPFGAE